MAEVSPLPLVVILSRSYTRNCIVFGMVLEASPEPIFLGKMKDVINKLEWEVGHCMRLRTGIEWGLQNGRMGLVEGATDKLLEVSNLGKGVNARVKIFTLPLINCRCKPRSWSIWKLDRSLPSRFPSSCAWGPKSKALLALNSK